MKATLHLAISADGFIAKMNGDSDWVMSIDEALFKTRAKEAGCLVIGRKTYEQYKDSIYPVEGVVNIVLTSNSNLKIKGATVVNTPTTAVKFAKEKGCANILIAGGAQTSATFLSAGFIDEIFFSVHPLILGQGIKPFTGIISECKVKLIDTKELGDGLVELHYEVLK